MCRASGTVLLCVVVLRHWVTGAGLCCLQALALPWGLALPPIPAPGTSNPRPLPWTGVNPRRASALQTKASPEVWRKPPSAGGVAEERKALETKVGDQGVARRGPLSLPLPSRIPTLGHSCPGAPAPDSSPQGEGRAGTGWGQN